MGQFSVEINSVGFVLWRRERRRPSNRCVTMTRVKNSNGEPLAYLTSTLTAVAKGHEQRRIDCLLP